MGLSAAEKQRLYRQRRDADLERRQKYLQTKQEKYKKDKMQGKRKLVKDMTRREHKAQKKHWNKWQQDSRKKQKIIQQQETPPCTPPDGPSPSTPPRARHLRNKRRKQKQELRKQISNLQDSLQKEQRKDEMYKKRYQRLSEKPGPDDTPRSKSRKLLRKSRNDPSSKTKVRKTLIFHYSLLEQLKENYRPRKTSAADLLAG